MWRSTTNHTYLTSKTRPFSTYFESDFLLLFIFCANFNRFAATISSSTTPFPTLINGFGESTTATLGATRKTLKIYFKHILSQFQPSSTKLTSFFFSFSFSFFTFLLLSSPFLSIIDATVFFDLLDSSKLRMVFGAFACILPQCSADCRVALYLSMKSNCW